MSRHERVGWLMFALSGLFFIAIGIRERDVLTLLAAVVWIIGCAAFLTGGKS